MEDTSFQTWIESCTTGRGGTMRAGPTRRGRSEAWWRVCDVTVTVFVQHRYFKTSPAMTPVDQLQLPAKKKTAAERDLEDQAAAGIVRLRHPASPQKANHRTPSKERVGQTGSQQLR